MPSQYARGVCIVFALVVVVSPSWAERPARQDAEAPQFLHLAQAGELRAAGDGSLELRLEPAAVRQLQHRRRVVVRDFPLPGRVHVDLDLTPFDILAPGARMIVVDEHGEREAPLPAFQAFRGRVVGDADSRVTLSVFEGRIAGSIRTWDDEFVFAPRQFNLARDGSREIRIWPGAADPDRPDSPLCGSDPEPAHHRGTMLSHLAAGAASAPAAPAIDGSTLLTADVAVDATCDWYDHFGSVEAGQNYILNLLAQVSTIFENEAFVQLQVPYIRIFTIPSDPYTGGATDTTLLLGELRAEWNANQSEVDRTVAHLFSVRPSGGSGLAYVDVLCGNAFQPGDSYDYGVTTLSAAGGSWEKDLLAHELGHNFASEHTHCYSPEIDQCANQSGCYQGPIVESPSTIMSYCSQATSSFDPRVLNEAIRPAAEAAFPTCIDTAGLPGGLRSSGAVQLSKPQQCPTESLANDDGSLNQYYGYGGTSQMAWVKRFTPGCYPFLLDRVDVLVGHASSVSVGRAVRVLVYTDATGSGDPANATLVHAEDTTLQVISNSVFNQFTLAAPVPLASGDYYIGLYDLEDDATATYIGSVDFSTEGDSYRTADSTAPQDLQMHGGGTWMIHGSGGPVGLDGLALEWGAPCNGAATPDQDFAIYQGQFGDFSNYSSLTCTTARQTSYTVLGVSSDSFFLVVPRTSVNEGSYGLDGTGAERAAAAAACALHSTGSCP